MPIHSLGKGCYRWGTRGKRYCGSGARSKAVRQAQAAHAHGYKGHASKRPRHR